VAPESLQTLVDAALAGDMSEPAGGYDLTRTVLELIQDRRRQHEELLVRFRDKWAELNALRRMTDFKPT
jgi:hypothetical protein